MKLTDTIDALLRPTVEGMGYALDEVEYQKEDGNMVLTLYLEFPDGRAVSLDDCEKVSRAADLMLDEADPISEPYYLSVSSIGLDRPLKKEKDFLRNIGKKVTVKLYAPVQKKKEFIGTLAAFDAESLTLDADGRQIVIRRRDAALVRPYLSFEPLGELETEDGQLAEGSELAIDAEAEDAGPEE